MAPYVFNWPPVVVPKPLPVDQGLDGEYKLLLKKQQREEARQASDAEWRKKRRREAESLEKGRQTRLKKKNAERLSLGGTPYKIETRLEALDRVVIDLNVALVYESIPYEAFDISDEDRELHNDKARQIRQADDERAHVILQEMREDWDAETQRQVLTYPTHIEVPADYPVELHCQLPPDPDAGVPPSEWEFWIAPTLSPEDARMAAIMGHVRGRRRRDLQERIDARERRMDF